MRLHLLTDGFTSPNGGAFLFPLVIFREAIRERGIDVRFVYDHEQMSFDCDVIAVDSKYLRGWWQHNADAAIDLLRQFRSRVGKVVFFDTTDGSGWIQKQVLETVDIYAKSLLLIERERYASGFYGQRPYTDYYHRQFDVVDRSPLRSTPIETPGLLGKLRVSWNSGLANWSVFGPLKAKLFQYSSWKHLLAPPKNYTSPANARPINFSCRMGISYERDTVAYQRVQMRKLLGDELPTNKLSRRQYFSEMQKAKLVLSPFGLGEITLKDFEVFLCGGLLVKPRMEHVETWPNLFVEDETMITHSWDLSDMRTVMNEMLSDDSKRTTIAQNAQQRYRLHLEPKTGGPLFAQHLHELLTHV